MTETRADFQGTGALAEFTLDFAKAMLRTGYYAPSRGYRLAIRRAGQVGKT